MNFVSNKNVLEYYRDLGYYAMTHISQKKFDKALRSLRFIWATQPKSADFAPKYLMPQIHLTWEQTWKITNAFGEQEHDIDSYVAVGAFMHFHKFMTKKPLDLSALKNYHQFTKTVDKIEVEAILNVLMESFGGSIHVMHLEETEMTQEFLSFATIGKGPMIQNMAFCILKHEGEICAIWVEEFTPSQFCRMFTFNF